MPPAYRSRAMHAVLMLGLALACLPSAAHAGIDAQETRLLAGLSPPRALADLERLSERGGTTGTGLGAGTIVSGSPEEAAAAGGIAAAMRAMGLEVSVEEFPVRAYRYGPVTLSANGTALAAISLHATGGTWGTRDGVPFAHGNAGVHRLRAALVDAGGGYEEDYARIGDVRGKVVLVQRELRDWPPPQITEAAHHGAVAVLFYDHPSASEQPDALRQDSLWGHDQLPGIAISRRAGEGLKAALAKGPVEIELENRMDVADGTSRNVVARLRGREEPDEYAVVSAHYDRWFRGAADNTSGVAAVLEIARAFKASGLKPRRTLMFLLVGSEEAGLEDPERDWLAGSNAFMLRHPEVLRRAALVFNIDLLGRTSDKASLSSTPDLTAQEARVLRDLGLDSQISQKPTFGSSIDAWNYGVVSGAATSHVNRIPESYYAIYHTQVDDYRPERFGNMGMDLRLISLSLWRAATAQRLPIALTSAADYVDAQVAKDAAKVPDVSFDGLHKTIGRFREASAAVEAMQDPARDRDVNRVLMATRHSLVPWLYASDDDFEQATRTALLATRVSVLDRLPAALTATDTAAAVSVLQELYEGRQCLHLAPAVYEFERSFWAGEGGWASRFQHRAPPPPPGFEAACAMIRTPGADRAAILSTITTLRTHAAQQVAEAVALMTARLDAATARLDDFRLNLPPPAATAAALTAPRH